MASEVKPRLLTRPDYVVRTSDVEDAHKRWGCNCGPAALATMTGLNPDDVRSHIPGFDAKRYISPSMMLPALDSLGVLYRPVSGASNFTKNGLVRIQWDGPWCADGVPIAARYRWTHWIGAMSHEGQTWVYDVNAGWWITAEAWEAAVVPEITSFIKRASGKWWSTHRLEFLGVRPAKAVPHGL